MLPRALSAHPRVGGENGTLLLTLIFVTGSSPRGRGKRGPGRVRRNRQGLIPAWAGKTVPRVFVYVHEPAHPRVGGENEETDRVANRVAGSSPRGRGKLSTLMSVWRIFGLIPAWAGKTEHLDDRRDDGRAHPRVGGENVAHLHT